MQDILKNFKLDKNKINYFTYDESEIGDFIYSEVRKIIRLIDKTINSKFASSLQVKIADKLQNVLLFEFLIKKIYEKHNNEQFLIFLDDNKSYKYLIQKNYQNLLLIKTRQKLNFSINEGFYKFIKYLWIEQYVLHFVNLICVKSKKKVKKLNKKFNIVIYDTFNESVINKLNTYISTTHFENSYQFISIITNIKIVKYLNNNSNYVLSTNLLSFKIKKILNEFFLYLFKFSILNKQLKKINYACLLPSFRMIINLALANYEYSVYFKYFEENKDKIDYVISNTSVHPRTSIFFKICDELGIDYKILAHGYPFSKVGYLPVKNLVVYDDFSRKIFEDWGVTNVEKIDLYNLKNLKIDNEKKDDILICLSPDGIINKKILLFVESFCLNNPITNKYRIRKHPGTTFILKDIIEFSKKNKNFYFDLYNNSIESIYNSKFVITFYSTILFEASLLNKSSVAVYDCNYFSHFNIKDSYFVNNYFEFEIAMKKILN